MFIYLLILLLELTAFFSVSPVFALLAIDPSSDLFANSISQEQRVFIYGLLNSIYPVCQFFASPIVGSISDNMSRKNVLIIISLSNGIGYLLVALGAYFSSILSVILGLALPGLSGGIFPIIKTYIAELTDIKERSRGFSFIALIKAISTILGPLLYVIICTFCYSHQSNFYLYVLPFIISSLLSFGVFLISFYFVKDNKKNSISLKKGRLNYENFLNFDFSIIIMFISFLFVIAGWWSYVKFAPVYFFQNFIPDKKIFSYFLCILGIGNVCTQLIHIKFLNKKFSSKKIIIWALPILSLSMVLLLYSNSLSQGLVLFTFAIFTQGSSIPHMEASISKMTNSLNQGKIQGMTQSMEALGRITGPFLCGLIGMINIQYTIILAAFFIILAFCGFQLFLFRKNEELDLKNLKNFSNSE